MSQCKQIFGNIFVTSCSISSNSPRWFEGFRRALKQNFIWIQQQTKNFPIDPHCKNRPLSTTIFTMGVYGEIRDPLSDSNEISQHSWSKNLQIIKVGLSLIERDVTKISPKIRLHLDMSRTVVLSRRCKWLFCDKGTAAALILPYHLPILDNQMYHVR